MRLALTWEGIEGLEGLEGFWKYCEIGDCYK